MLYCSLLLILYSIYVFIININFCIHYSHSIRNYLCSKNISNKKNEKKILFIIIHQPISNLIGLFFLYANRVALEFFIRTLYMVILTRISISICNGTYTKVLRKTI